MVCQLKKINKKMNVPDCQIDLILVYGYLKDKLNKHSSTAFLIYSYVLTS